MQPDYVAAYDGALAGQPGIIVIAGTGQVAYGEDGRGGTARAGGYGFLIDDSGSAYGVGRSAIAAVLRAMDGTGPRTSLTQTLSKLLSVNSGSDIIAGVYGGSIDRVRIASLAAAVSGDADSGDVVAAELLRDAARSLGSLALNVGAKLNIPGGPVRLARVGGLWNSKILSAEFAKYLKDRASNMLMVDASYDPATGAALRARRLLDMQCDGQ
jgi:N-acetylglucosamine kinase-like BadF-type ATPase